MVSDEWMLDLEVGRWSEVHSTIIIFAKLYILCLSWEEAGYNKGPVKKE
jgi:hypothetical protein